MHTINWKYAILAGVAGLNMGADMAIGSMIRHWLFAVPLIFIVNKDLFKQGD